MLNYHLRQFRGKSNAPNGEVSASTLFTYYQNGSRLWGDYAGGDILRGQLQGKVHPDGSIFFLYQHENTAGTLMAGQCHSRPKLMENGLLLLQESWQWFTGDQSCGYSEVEEIPSENLPLT